MTHIENRLKQNIACLTERETQIKGEGNKSVWERERERVQAEMQKKMKMRLMILCPFRLIGLNWKIAAPQCQTNK